MKKHVWLVLLMLVAAMAFAGCGSSGGGSNDTDTQAQDGDTEKDTDTEATSQDGDSDTAEAGSEADSEAPIEKGDPCKDSSQCAEGLACHPDKLTCETVECSADAECTTAPDVCRGSFCLPKLCTQNSGCPSGFSCQGGVCATAIAPTDVASLVINEGSGMIVDGANRQLTITAYTVNGVAISPTPAAAWTSDKADTVAVDATTGKLTGGATTGTATITATLNSKTATVTYNNFAAVADGSSRVILFDQKTGALVSTAKVYLTAASKKARKDDAGVTPVNGVADFAGVTCTAGCNVHVFATGYTYISLLGIASNDIVVPLIADSDNTKADGVVGSQDLSGIPAALKDDIQIGISMFSIPGNLADLNFTSLIGEMINTHITAAGLDQDVKLPSGLEGYLKGAAIKKGYEAVGLPGPNTLWGLAGYLNLKQVMGIVQLYKGTDSIGPILAAVLPLISNFYHGVQTGITLTSRDKVADDGTNGMTDESGDKISDMNADGSTTDLVANFKDFQKINLKITQKQSQSVSFTYPTMPTVNGACTDAVVSLVGAMQTGVGFIPLGLTAGVDKNSSTETADCKVGTNSDNKVSGTYAPQHDGLNGFEYYTVSVAAPMTALISGSSKSVDLVGSVTHTTAAPSAVTVPAFIGFMSDAAVTNNAGTVTVKAAKVDSATFHRVVLAKTSSDKKTTAYWHIYWGPAAANATIALPTDVDNRADGFEGSSLAQAIKLSKDGATLSYEKLFSFDDNNVTKMNDLLESFSMHALTAVSTSK